jgi:hypothetical protein
MVSLMPANLTPTIAHAFVLKCHPETSSSARGLEACVRCTESGALGITFALKGDIALLRIPQSSTSCRADGFWQHTCFEAFIGVKGIPVYFEFNFSPSGEWAAYAFRDYRDGGPINDDKLDPKIVVQKETERLELSAVMRLHRLSAIQPGVALRVGLSAVIEEQDGKLSYWALKHPPGKPDFHHSDNFTLEIQPPVDGVSAIAYTGKP